MWRQIVFNSYLWEIGAGCDGGSYSCVLVKTLEHVAQKNNSAYGSLSVLFKMLPFVKSSQDGTVTTYRYNWPRSPLQRIKYSDVRHIRALYLMQILIQG